MSSINTQNILSPVQANPVDRRTVFEDSPALHTSVNAFNYEWFVLSNSTASAEPVATPPTSTILPTNTISQVDSTAAVGGSMESRVERIVQFILPRA